MLQKILVSVVSFLMVTVCGLKNADAGWLFGSSDAKNEKASPSETMEDIQPSSSNVEDDYTEWLYQVAVPNLQKKCAQKGVDLSLPECNADVFFYGDGMVSLAVEDPHFVDARVMAYNRALVKAYGAAAEFLNLNNEVKMVSEYFEDSEKPELGNDVKSNVEVLIDKLVAVADGTLNQKLSELGIDPSKFEGAPESVKKTMLKDAFSEKSVKKALASTTGMVPYQTFEGRDQEGNHVIRVVVSTEPDRIALIKTIVAKRAQIMPNEDKKAQKSLYERLVLDKADLVNQFGVRLVYDEQGYPVLVAFGQAGVANSATRGGKAARSEIAHKKAVSRADAALTLLLNSTTMLKEIRKDMLQHLEEEKLISDKTSDMIEEEMIDTDTYDEYLDSTTSTSGHIENFAGRREFYNWTYELPKTKQKIKGVILTWSPKTAQYAKDVKAAKSFSRPEPQKVQKAPEKPAAEVPSRVIRGIESDF